MFKPLLAKYFVTAPSIWGKVPGHADFVSRGMRGGEREEWERWLSVLPACPAERRVPASAALPVAFVLPPGTLRFAQHRFVVGVVSRSVDRLGRPHALVIYQLASTRWLQRHLASHAEHPHDWFFWLARTVARHAGLSEAADIRALERALDDLWRLHEPAASQWMPAAWRGSADRAVLATRSRALLDRVLGAAAPSDLAHRLAGVRYMPWADWPERIFVPARHGRASRPDAVASDIATGFQGAFWQQDDGGGFVNVATRLETLWTGSP
jgi:type VI secretion system protein ImpM